MTDPSAHQVRLIAPSGPLNPKSFEAGVAVMRHLGIEPKWPTLLMARDGFLAGPDRARAQDLQAALTEEPVALWMARGGYGALRTLAACPQDLFTAAPVPLWAFSDGTALLAAWDRAGWPAWHAPPPTQFTRLDTPSLARVRAAWHANHVAPFEGLTPLVPGQVSGPLAGGNLCVLASMIGTPWQANLSDRIVMLEDTGEPAYKVDRLLHQLLYAGAFEGSLGMVFGAFTAVPTPEVEAIEQVLADFAQTLGIPAASGLPVGHDKQNAPLPFGVNSGHTATLTVPTDHSSGTLTMRTK
jgi:muramoyltetrapeptide carboxypeptidase